MSLENGKIERFWSDCIDEFAEMPSDPSPERVLMAVTEAMQQIQYAEAHSNYYRGEIPRLDAAFDAARAAIEAVRLILGGAR